MGKFMGIGGTTGDEAVAAKFDEAGILSGAKKMTLHQNSEDTGNGKDFEVAGYTSVVVIVTGNFNGEIRFRGKYAEDNEKKIWDLPNIVDLQNKRIVNGAIESTGIYGVEIGAIETFYARIEEINTGSATIEAYAYKSNNSIIEEVIRRDNQKSVKRQVIHRETTDGGNGDFLNVEGYDSVTFTVSGNYNGKLYVKGDYGSEGKIDDLMDVVDLMRKMRVYTPYIKGEGIYAVDVRGIKRMYVRSEDQTEGSLTVEAFAFKEPNSIFERIKDKRVVEIKRGSGVEISALDSYSDASIKVDDFVFTFMTIRAAEDHNFRVQFSYTATNRGLTTTGLDDFVIHEAQVGREVVFESEGNKRGSTEYIYVKGISQNIYINNDSNENQTYDYVLYGVR